MGLSELRKTVGHMLRREVSADEPVDVLAWVAFGVMAVSMSITFVFVELSLESFSPMEAAGGRIVIATLCLVPLAFLFGKGLPRELWFWKWAVAIGLFNFALPFFLLSFSQSYLPSNLVGAMFGLIPLATIGLSALFLQVHISRRKLLGIFVGFLGLGVLTEPGKWMASTGMEQALPMLAALGAILCIAFTAILIRKAPAVHPLSLLAGSALVASLFGIVPVLSIFDGEPATARAWGGLLGGAVFSTTLALSLRFFLIRRKGPVFLAPNAYVGVVLANVFGVSLLGDAITPAMWVSFPLIVLGLAIAQDGSGNMKQV